MNNQQFRDGAKGLPPVMPSVWARSWNYYGRGIYLLLWEALPVSWLFVLTLTVHGVPPDTQPTIEPRIVRFQNGVWINWTQRQVEIEATVILREGLIELFACSPRIREHESIVRVEARPSHIYQAMGLIGLTPGRPVTYDPVTGIWAPPTGDPVIVEIQYLRDGQTITEPIERWMIASGPQPSADHKIQDVPWVFAGSMPLENGSITADDEGTVVALVDFDSALVAPAELHSDRNEELWLAPNTEYIPAIHTACRLIIRPGPVRITITSSGRFLLEGRAMTLGRLAGRIRHWVQERPDARFEVFVQPGCGGGPQEILMGLLRNLEVAETAVTIRQATSRPAEQHNPQVLAEWFRRRLVSKTLPAESADPLGRLADDLERRSVTFRTRSENVTSFVRQLVHDLQQLFDPLATVTTHPIPKEPGGSAR